MFPVGGVRDRGNMAYATVAELKAYLADPVSGATSSSGMTDANGVIVSGVRWADPQLQAELDGASAYLDGMTEAAVTIAEGNMVARTITLELAAAAILESSLPETMEGETRTRAYTLRKSADSWVSKVRQCPTMLGVLRGRAYYV